MTITGLGPVAAATAAAVATPAAGVAPAAVIAPGTAVLAAKIRAPHVLVLGRVAEVSRGWHVAGAVAVDHVADELLARGNPRPDRQTAGEVAHEARTARWRIAGPVAVTRLHARAAGRQQARTIALRIRARAAAQNADQHEAADHQHEDQAPRHRGMARD